jgi:hypothetical protein
VWQDLDAEQWCEDLDFLADRLRREHRNPFHTTSPEAFERAVRTLRDRIPWLAGHEIVVGLARIVAQIGDGHSILRLTAVPGFRRYPVNIYRFSDGLFVRSIAAAHGIDHGVAGSRLVAIDGTPAEDVYALMRPLVSRDNEMGMVATAPELLRIPEVLHATGVVQDPERASFTLQLPGGEVRTLALQPFSALPSSPASPSDLVDARDRATAPTPLWLRSEGAEGTNWFEHLPEDNALYVAYQSVRDGANERLGAFFDRVFAVIRDEAIDRLILDIRLNGGGNNLLNRPLVHHLIRCDRINRWGGLFTIVGRQTFSAAMNLVVDLEQHTRVLFVGEPTGSSPNHYGETTMATLPRSQLPFSISTRWWQTSSPIDDRPWVFPDIPARLTIEDYIENRDPALDAALRYRPGPASPLEYPDRLYAQLRPGGKRQSPAPERVPIDPEVEGPGT